ncbi:unnamed protein product [Cylicocyclus nassatus]|uniref:Uncharacterized protein n=1 Tax=Cylicocyclus nassatus TaxID=53992 RepID=A0AA36HAQ5_CYLNA|nr:unnamed protein product [Cylicocyclus nassatus]
MILVTDEYRVASASTAVSSVFFNPIFGKLQLLLSTGYAKMTSTNQNAPNMGHRHSLTIETNPLHLLPSNMRRFSQADSLRHPAAPMLAKLQGTVPPNIPESDVSEKKDENKDKESPK